MHERQWNITDSLLILAGQVRPEEVNASDQARIDYANSLHRFFPGNNQLNFFEVVESVGDLLKSNDMTMNVQMTDLPERLEIVLEGMVRAGILDRAADISPSEFAQKFVTTVKHLVNHPLVR